jgi:hypothetical protein
LDDRFKATEVESFKNALAKMEQEAKIKDERLQALEKTVAILKRDHPVVATVLRSKPPLYEVEASLRRKSTQSSSKAASQK